MIGTMADILLKKPMYKEQMEKFLVEIVFPEFASPHGHLRYSALLKSPRVCLTSRSPQVQ
jgi:hypothetical protein